MWSASSKARGKSSSQRTFHTICTSWGWINYDDDDYDGNDDYDDDNDFNEDNDYYVLLTLSQKTLNRGGS